MYSIYTCSIYIAYIVYGIYSIGWRRGDKKGAGTLTELPITNYGTLRRSTRLPGRFASRGNQALSCRFPMHLHRNEGANVAGTGTYIMEKAPSLPQTSFSRPDDVLSVASKRSAASQRSQKSTASSRRTASSSASWARRTQEQQERQQWNFEGLPFYERTNASYGRRV